MIKQRGNSTRSEQSTTDGVKIVHSMLAAAVEVASAKGSKSDFLGVVWGPDRGRCPSWYTEYRCANTTRLQVQGPFKDENRAARGKLYKCYESDTTSTLLPLPTGDPDSAGFCRCSFRRDGAKRYRARPGTWRSSLELPYERGTGLPKS